jgi:hypothetical protein
MEAPQPRGFFFGSSGGYATCAVPSSTHEVFHCGADRGLLRGSLAHGDLDAILTLFTPEALEVFGSEALILEQIHAERVVIVTGQPSCPPCRSAWLIGRRRRISPRCMPCAIS